MVNTNAEWAIVNVAGEGSEERSLVVSIGGKDYAPFRCEECGYSVAHLTTVRGFRGYSEAVCCKCDSGSDILNVEFAGTEKALLRDIASAIFGCIDCENGDVCRLGMDCHFVRQSAIDAGIPRRVVYGLDKLTDYYSREHIARMAGSETQAEQDRRDMIDAGRGHLLRGDES